jgi:predicted MFS family arabinose efflux permease
MSLGEVVGPLLGGYLVDAWGFENSAAVMGGLGLVLLVMFLVSERQQNESLQPILTSES